MKQYKSKALIKKLYKSDVKNIKLSDFNSEEGFFIKSNDYFHIELKRENILYSIVFEGNISEKIKLEQIKNNLIKRMDCLIQKKIGNSI